MSDGINFWLETRVPLITTPWIAIATVFLFAQKYQGPIIRLLFIAVLVCWYWFAGKPGYSEVFTEILTEATRWRHSRNLLGRHYTLNILECIITQVITEIIVFAFPGWTWSSIIATSLVVWIFYRFNVVQLWMQKQLSRLVRLNRILWQSLGLLVEKTLIFVGALVDSPSTRAIVRGLLRQWYGFNTGITATLDAHMIVIWMSYLVDGLSPVRDIFLRQFNVLIIYYIFFRHLGKFANPEPLKYKYVPMKNPQDIRVILLYPRLVFLPICCSLLQGPNMKLLFYEAISYTWGDLAATEDILVDGCTMKVTKSVYEVLATYSSSFMPKLLWIDFVCINQEDHVEKANQVQLMRKIYGGAEFCTVFLGQAPIHLELAQQEISSPFHFRYASISHNDNRGRRLHFESASLAIDLLNELEVLDGVLQGSTGSIYEDYELLSRTMSKSWAALLSMLRHPWFERIWVVQEVALSNTVQVRYGDEIIKWEILANGIKRLQNTRGLSLWLEWRHNVGLRQIEHTSLQNITRIHSLREEMQDPIYWRARRGVKLSKLLAKSFYFKASNPRDLIYGLLGLCCDEVSVDYGSSVEDVYLNAAKAMYEEGAINLLFHSAGIGNRLGINPDTSRLPSWVPDWTNAPRYTQLTGFRSGGNFENKFQCSMTHTLGLSGICIDSIHMIGSVLHNTTHLEGEWTIEEMRQLAAGYEKSWTQIEESPTSRDPYPHVAGTQSLREAFRQTMLLSQFWMGGSYETRTKLLDYLIQWEEDLKCFLLDQSVSNSDEEDAIYQRLRRMDKVTELVKASWKGRLTFSTKAGYIGLCPPYTQPGDLIVIVRGLGVPIVLRTIKEAWKPPTSRDASPEKYRLVGQCYAHGLMNGEALSMGIEEKKIEII